VVGADIELVGELVGRRGLLRSRLSVDTIRAASPSDRVGPPRLVRACSKGGYEEPGSKGHHCRSMARCGAMLVRRCGRCNSQNVGGVDDEIDLNEGVVILKGSVRTTAAEGLREAVFGGLGLCVASEWMFQPDLDNGRVKQVARLGLAADGFVGGVPDGPPRQREGARQTSRSKLPWTGVPHGQ